MTRAIVIALGVALSMSTAAAQPKRTQKKQPAPKKDAPPAPAPTPTPEPPAPEQPPPTPPKDPNKPPDAADNLQTGSQNVRPWADGVSQERQDTAVRLFTEGNGHLNDGIFGKAVDAYAEALKSWDHPAIHYNMAIA